MYVYNIAIVHKLYLYDCRLSITVHGATNENSNVQVATQCSYISTDYNKIVDYSYLAK